MWFVFFEPPFCPINNPYVLLPGNITPLHFTEERARKAFILLAPAELLNPPNKEFRFCRQTMQGFIQGFMCRICFLWRLLLCRLIWIYWVYLIILQSVLVHLGVGVWVGGLACPLLVSGVSTLLHYTTSLHNYTADTADYYALCAPLVSDKYFIFANILHDPFLSQTISWFMTFWRQSIGFELKL